MMKLVLAHITDRPMAALLNIGLIAFTSALLMALTAVTMHVSNRFERDMAGIDLVVSAKGSPLQIILSSLFHVDAPTGNVSVDAVEGLMRDPLVKQAIPIATGDRFRGFRVVGTTPAYLALYGAEAATGEASIGEEEAVAGAAAASATGLQVGQRIAISHGLGGEDGPEHAAHPLTIAGVLKPTGTVIDRLILTNIEAVWEAHGIHDDHDETHDHEHDDDEDHAEEMASEPSDQAREPEYTALLIRYASPLAAIRLPQKINTQGTLMAAVPAFESARLLNLFGAGRETLAIVATAFAALGAFAIFAGLWSALNQREHDIALFRLLGASKSQVIRLLVLEGALVAGLGGLLGWAVSRVFLWRLASTVPTLGDSGLRLFATSSPELLIMAATLILGALAALPAGLRAARLPLERALG
ncbi:MAG: FtsX-like permease family protein [Pseudomonadota bacterium]